MNPCERKAFYAPDLSREAPVVFCTGVAGGVFCEDGSLCFDGSRKASAIEILARISSAIVLA